MIRLLLLIPFAIGCWSSTVDEVKPDMSDHEKLSDPVRKPSEWPAWRGPNKNGIANGELPPTDISKTKNVLWKARIPGKGHGSPIVAGGNIYLTTADESERIQYLLCLNAETGDEVWKSVVHEGGFPGQKNIHREASNANSTPAHDGEFVFLGSLHKDHAWVTAFHAKTGKQLWQTKTGPFEVDFGYTFSPCLWKSFVILAADSKDGSHLIALHRKTGKIFWRKQRPKKRSYTSPVVKNIGGKERLLICGCNRVDAYDPATGEEHWSIKSKCEAMVGTPTWLEGESDDDDVVFAAGGYPGSEVFAIRATDGDVIWKDNVQVYVPSLVAHEGFVYGITNAGHAICWQASNGDVKWRKRLGGAVRSSPTLCNGHIFVLGMSGAFTIYKADPQEFRRVRSVSLGDEGYATPTIANGRLYVRVVEGRRSNRQEWLYCFGKK